MISYELVGYCAGSLTTAAFLPQVWQAFRSRSCRDLSYLMLVVLTTGQALWTIYGILLHRWAIIVPNLITFCLVLSLLIMKATYHSPLEEKR